MCKTQIYRVEGCIHIKCPVCDYEWCWKCGREHEANHHLGCTEEWSPLPPKKFQKEQKKNQWKKNVNKALKSVKKLILWPFTVTKKLAIERNPPIITEQTEQPRWVNGNAQEFNFVNQIGGGAPRGDEHDLPADDFDFGPPGANDDGDYFGAQNNTPAQLMLGNGAMGNIVVHPLARVTVDHNTQFTRGGSIDLLQGFEY